MRYVSSKTLFAVALFALATAPAWGNSARVDPSADRDLTSPGKIAVAPAEQGAPLFATVEEAAVAALDETDARAIRKGRRHLYVGTIIRTEGGYSFERPRHSGEAGRASWRPQARVDLGHEHVATYIVHPRTGDRRIDRLNERFSKRQRHFVDTVDALHRPMFMLTPSGRVVRYGHTPAGDAGMSLVSND